MTRIHAAAPQTPTELMALFTDTYPKTVTTTTDLNKDADADAEAHKHPWKFIASTDCFSFHIMDDLADLYFCPNCKMFGLECYYGSKCKMIRYDYPIDECQIYTPQKVYSMIKSDHELAHLLKEFIKTCEEYDLKLH